MFVDAWLAAISADLREALAHLRHDATIRDTNTPLLYFTLLCLSLQIFLYAVEMWLKSGWKENTADSHNTSQKARLLVIGYALISNNKTQYLCSNEENFDPIV